MLCYMLLLCYVMLKYIFLYHNILYSYFFQLSKVASSIILPAKTEPIWTLTEPVTKTLCLQMGGGGLRPPPTPLPPRLSFQAVQACVQEHHTMNKTCTKHKTVLELFTAHLTGILFAKAGCVIVLWYIML